MGCRVGIKAGKFSLIHGGHIACLKHCKSLCDYLVVLTQSDSIIKEISGHEPPMPLNERIFMLESLRFVDEVRVYNALTEDSHVEGLTESLNKTFRRPHIIMFHSEEFENKQNVPCEDLVDEVIFIPRVFIYKYPPKYTSASHMIDCIAKERNNVGES